MAAKNTRRPPSKDTSSSSSNNTEPKGKRRCVATACIPCRRRKSKCDGGLPKCSTCIAVYKTDCSYDANAIESSQGIVKPTNLKRASTAVEEPTSAEYLIKSFVDLPEHEAVELLHQLRSRGDVDTIAASLKRNLRFIEQEDHASAEGDHANVKGDIAVDQPFRYGFSSGLGLVPTEDAFEMPNPQHLPTTQLWTDVTTDRKLVNHLIKLYFTWTNHSLPVVSEKEFYADFANGKTEACSTILVNAICAMGALFTEDPAAREDPDDSWTAGDCFAERARFLIFEDKMAPRLTTVQALQIMSTREASFGRVSFGFRYAGCALTTAIELGMHLDGWKTTTHEDQMRKRSFWAIFNFDTAWSVCVGRVAMLPHAAVEIEKPDDTLATTRWELYNDGSREGSSPVVRHCYEQQVLHYHSSLTELTSEMLVIYYAPRERLSARRILDLYSRYQSWHRQLPNTLQLNEKATPNVFQLHMWFWTCVNHLFRPIVRMKLVGSGIQPRKVCIDAAIQISKIMNLYRTSYPMTTVNITWGHILLTAALTHIFDLPSRHQVEASFTEANHRALRDTAQCLRDCLAISLPNKFALRAIQVICAVAKKHDLQLLQDVLDELPPHLLPSAESTPEPLLAHRQKVKFDSSMPNNGLEADGTKLANDARRDYTNSDGFSYPQRTAAMTATSQATSYDQNQHAQSSRIPYPPPIENADSYPTSFFFTPVMGQIGVPLYHNDPSQSHMDLNIVLGDVDWPEQLRQDGFELSDVWGRGPSAGTHEPARNGHDHHQFMQHPAQHTLHSYGETYVRQY